MHGLWLIGYELICLKGLVIGLQTLTYFYECIFCSWWLARARPDQGCAGGVVAGLQIQFELVVAGGGAAHVRWDHLLHCTYGHRVYSCTGLHAIERVAAGPRQVGSDGYQAQSNAVTRIKMCVCVYFFILPYIICSYFDHHCYFKADVLCHQPSRKYLIHFMCF